MPDSNMQKQTSRPSDTYLELSAESFSSSSSLGEDGEKAIRAERRSQDTSGRSTCTQNQFVKHLSSKAIGFMPWPRAFNRK